MIGIRRESSLVYSLTAKAAYTTFISIDMSPHLIRYSALETVAVLVALRTPVCQGGQIPSPVQAMPSHDTNDTGQLFPAVQRKT